MARLVRFTAARNAEVVDFADPVPGPGEVLVQTTYSGISAGTELTAYRGSNPYLVKQWDPDRKLFVAGEATRAYPWDAIGYEEVGRVAAVAAESDEDLVGSLVFGAWGHRSHVVMPGDVARRRLLPADADPLVGIFSFMGAIALNAVLDADIHVGETVVVFGAGVPGQLVAQLARLNGGEVTVVDPVASRRQLAARLGAAEVLDPYADPVAERVRAATDNRGADVVIEMSGSYQALHQAVRTAAYSSRVVAAGFYQGPGIPLELGEEFHHNRVSIVGSQVYGVAPALQHRWDEPRLTRTVFALERTGRLSLLDLITDIVPAEEAARAFTLLDTAPEAALQVVLDYGQAK